MTSALTPTPWGYDANLSPYGGSVPPFITLGEFHGLTAHAFSQDDRVEAAIAGVSARIRSYCGWHVWPSLHCLATLDGGLRFASLPSNHVTALTALRVLGEDAAERSYEWGRDGLIRLPPTPDRYSAIEVGYDAGLAGDACPEDLAALVAHRVVHAVALPFGIQQETVGSVSRTYSTAAVAESGGPNLSARDRGLLSQYRIEEAV